MKLQLTQINLPGLFDVKVGCEGINLINLAQNVDHCLAHETFGSIKGWNFLTSCATVCFPEALFSVHLVS
jgi:hypothetical protein